MGIQSHQIYEGRSTWIMATASCTFTMQAMARAFSTTDVFYHNIQLATSLNPYEYKTLVMSSGITFRKGNVTIGVNYDNILPIGLAAFSKSFSSQVIANSLSIKCRISIKALPSFKIILTAIIIHLNLITNSSSSCFISASFARTKTSSSTVMFGELVILPSWSKCIVLPMEGNHSLE